jgi:hypothetical protein
MHSGTPKGTTKMKTSKSSSSLAIILSNGNLENITPIMLDSAMVDAWNADTVSGNQYSNIHRAYIAIHGEQYNPTELAEWFRVRATHLYNSSRSELCEAYESETETTDFSFEEVPAYNGVKHAWGNARKACAKYASGITFNTTGRLKPSQVLAGEVLASELDTTGYNANTPKQETASAKPKGKKAKGAKVETPEQGASALETVSGSFEQAKNAVMVCLKAYPRLALSNDMIRAFQEAQDVANSDAKIIAAKKAKRTTAKANALENKRTKKAA